MSQLQFVEPLLLVHLHIMSKLGSFWPLFFSCNLSATFWLSYPSGTHMMCSLVLLMVSHKTLRLCSLFFIIFSFCSSDLILSFSVLCSLVLSSAFSNLLLKPSSDYCNSVIAFYQHQNLVLFNNFFVDILIVFIYCFTEFIRFFVLFSFSSLSIFKTVLLMYLSDVCASSYMVFTN